MAKKKGLLKLFRRVPPPPHDDDDGSRVRNGSSRPSQHPAGDEEEPSLQIFDRPNRRRRDEGGSAAVAGSGSIALSATTVPKGSRNVRSSNFLRQQWQQAFWGGGEDEKSADMEPLFLREEDVIPAGRRKGGFPFSLSTDSLSERQLDFGLSKDAPTRSSRPLGLSKTASCQFLRASAGVGNSPVLQSTTRGSEDWRKVVRPFVSDLAFRSVVRRRRESDVSFQPYTCDAAVLFVDLSGYSKITAALAHRGAHALSTAVNAYLERLLQIVDRHGGDVVKFAGDAVLVVWEGDVGDDDDLEYNILCAAQCALDLQNEAGHHPIENGDKVSDLAFRIHCAVCHGILESEIFSAPSNSHMQRLYHAVSGQCLVDIGEMIDLAKAGEIAMSDDSLDYLGLRAEAIEIDDIMGAKLLVGLDIDPSLKCAMQQHVVDIRAVRAAQRNVGVEIEEEFIHPGVLQRLAHGGLSPTQIAQMRNLCVLFIAAFPSTSCHQSHSFFSFLFQNLIFAECKLSSTNTGAQSYRY